MQTGSSGTLIGWISGQTTFVPLWDRMEGAWLQTLGSRIQGHLFTGPLGCSAGNLEQSMEIDSWAP